MKGSEADNVCYLRDLADANRLVSVMQSNVGGNAVVIGGGYIGMECAASLVINKINVTMVFPEAHCSKFYAFFFFFCISLSLSWCLGLLGMSIKRMRHEYSMILTERGQKHVLCCI